MLVVLSQLKLVLVRGPETFWRRHLGIHVYFFLAVISSLMCESVTLDSSVTWQRDYQRYRQSHNERQVHLTTNMQSARLEIWEERVRC